jgi:hypothetical protein
MSTGDKTVDTMFDEITEVKITPDGRVEAKRLISDEETVASIDMQEAVNDFVRSERDFRALTVPVATNVWWRNLEYLALADSRLKECFCGRDRSKRTIKRTMSIGSR